MRPQRRASVGTPTGIRNQARQQARRSGCRCRGEKSKAWMQRHVCRTHSIHADNSAGFNPWLGIIHTLICDLGIRKPLLPTPVTSPNPPSPNPKSWESGISPSVQRNTKDSSRKDRLPPPRLFCDSPCFEDLQRQSLALSRPFGHPSPRALGPQKHPCLWTVLRGTLSSSRLETSSRGRGGKEGEVRGGGGVAS